LAFTVHEDSIHGCNRKRRDEFGSVCSRPSRLRRAVGETEAEVKRLIQEAIEFHLEDLTESGAEIPAPTSKSDYVEVLAA
jgi:predicted RNase H-like HicB family nuclease